MASIRTALLSAAVLPHTQAALVAHGAQSSVTPVEKVVNLLTNLKAELETDGSNEAKAYDKFACFCRDTTASKSSSITTGQDTIDSKSATIEEKTAEKASKTTELAGRQEKQEQLTAELQSTTARCAKEQATYEATAADLSKAIDGLNGALSSMQKSKPSSFLALRQSLRKTLGVAEALSGKRGRKQRLVAELLRHGSTVDPADPEYKFHSQNIIETISELLEEFTDEKKTLDEEWGKTKTSCDDTKKSLSDNLDTNKKAMGQLEIAIDSLQSGIASARGDLVSADAVLKDDQLYLKDLTQLCEARAKDWDQRSSMRADELKALSQAIEILDKGVVSQDVVNERALLLERPPLQAASSGHKAASFLQFNRASQVRSHDASSSTSFASERVGRIVSFLHDESKRLDAASLSMVASRAAASPFDKVKELIQQLVERLLKEATAEATKKGFCDTEMGKATQDRDARSSGKDKLSVEIAGLEAKEDQLTAEISELTDALTSLREDLSKANETRVEEKQENMETLKTSKEGLAAVTEAIGVLKAFYKQAAKAKVELLQASPVDEDTQGPGFEGAYKGKQEASTGIIGMLEVIKSDFERTVKKTTAAEKQAAAKYVDFERASKADIGGKETKKTLDEEDLETTQSSIKQKHEDLQTEMNLLDSALARLEELKPTCVDLTMPYEERVQKREEEIAALKKALCILDTDKVESECQ